MLVVKKIKALIYNWHSLGDIELNSNVYCQENLENSIILHSLKFTGELEKDITQYNPDIIVYEGELIKIDNSVLTEKCLQYAKFPTDEILANDIITHVISKNCSNVRPTFSIFTPSYKTEYKIFRAYESLKGQTFTDWEVIFFDNASTDNTLAICSSFNDPRIYIFKNEYNIGSHANFRKCFSLASSELVLMLPCDDVLEPNCIQILASKMLEDPTIGIAFGRTRRIDKNDSILFEPLFLESGEINFFRFLNFVANNFNPVQHPLVRKSVYCQNNGFKKYYGCFTDINLWINIAFTSQKIYIAEEFTTSIRSHPEQGQAIMADINEDNINLIANHFGNRSIIPCPYSSIGLGLYNLLCWGWLIDCDATRLEYLYLVRVT